MFDVVGDRLHTVLDYPPHKFPLPDGGVFAWQIPKKAHSRVSFNAKMVFNAAVFRPILLRTEHFHRTSRKAQECSRMTMSTATAKPKTVNTPASLPAFSYASGSIVLASIMSIAPPANVLTNDSSIGDALAKKR